MVTKICSKCLRYYTTFDTNSSLCDNCLRNFKPLSFNYHKASNTFVSQKPIVRPMVQQRPIDKPIQPVQRKSEVVLDEEPEEIKIPIQQQFNKRKDYRIIFRCEEELFNVLNQYEDKSELIRRALRHYIKKHLNKNE